MNFTRGKQVVIHNSTYRAKDDSPYFAPKSLSTWKIFPNDSVNQIMKDLAALAAETGKLDAIHFITHGLPGYFELGREHIRMSNVNVFEPLKDAARNIVIWACQVGADITPGADQNPHSLGCAIAQKTNAKVIVGKQNQSYGGAFGWTVNERGFLDINPNFFWGEIYLCHPGGGHLVVFKDSRSEKAQINIEPYLFPGSKN
jgi:hypothetical protein